MNQLLLSQIQALNDPSVLPISRLSNMIAAIYWSDPGINWAGIYYVDHTQQAVLGPFQGKPACTIIHSGKGVIGACIAKKGSLAVEDVLSFPGHIACDAGSRSELVIPLFTKEGQLGAVLDLDSSKPAFFSQEDVSLLQACAAILQDCAFCVTL